MNANGSHWIRDEKRVAIYERDNWQCVYCGFGPRSKRNRQQASVILSLDHIVPRHLGGSNDASNLVTACKICNSSRGCRDIEKYAPDCVVERIAFLITQKINIALGKAIVASIAGSASN